MLDSLGQEARHPGLAAARPLRAPALLLLLIAFFACRPSGARYTLAGWVSDGESPIAAVQVRLFDEGDASAPVAEAETDAEGHFALAGVADGRYLVALAHDGYEPFLSGGFAVTSDRDNLSYILVPLGDEQHLVGGRVLGETVLATLPVAGARVTLVPVDEGLAPLERLTASNGSFLFEAPSGTFLLRIRADGYLPFESAPLTVGGDQEGLEFRLTPANEPGTVAIGGRVSDGTSGLAAAVVDLFSVAGSQATPAGSGVTNPDGYFVFLGRPAGSYRIEAAKVGFQPASLDFAAQQDVFTIALTLIPSAITRLRFAVQSDVHVYQSGAVAPGMKNVVRGTIEAVHPSFVVFSGDMTSGNPSSPTSIDAINLYWDSFFAAIEGYLPSHIYAFPSRGNHDCYTSLQRTVYQERWSTLTVPGVAIQGDPSSYYAFDVGSSHFTVLAGNSTNLGTTQTDWLRSDLQAAQTASHRFVISHLPLVTKMIDGGHGTIHGATSDGVGLIEVLQEGHITALLCGHEHVYDDDPHAVPGVRQVICGTAAGTYNYPFADGTRQELVPSMVVVDIDDGEVSIQGVRDPPSFTTTWQGATIPPSPPTVIAGPPPPVADILVVDGWQRGDLADREALRLRATAMFSGMVGTAGPLGAAVVSQAAVASGVVSLSAYPAVVYLLENESQADVTLDAVERQMVGDYLAAGGRLILSGSEIAYDLDHLQVDPGFYHDQLHARYVGDDAASGSVIGVEGSSFAGLTANFDEAHDPHRFPDVIQPMGGAVHLMRYASGGDAAIGWTSTAGGGVVFGFAIDGVDTPEGRRHVAEAALRYLGVVP